MQLYPAAPCGKLTQFLDAFYLNLSLCFKLQQLYSSVITNLRQQLTLELMYWLFFCQVAIEKNETPPTPP